jgi:hypothetical protein
VRPRGLGVFPFAAVPAPLARCSLCFARMTIAWDEVSHEFGDEGALREIVVRGADLETWDRVLRHLQREHGPRFSVNDRVAGTPRDAAELLQAASGSMPLFSFRIAEVELTCHVTGGREIVFAFDPREVAGQEELDALIRFLEEIGRTAERDVILTYEYWRSESILRWDHAAGIVTTPGR